MTYNWVGKQYKGAMRDCREAKHQEAQERNACTEPENRRVAREGKPDTPQRDAALKVRHQRRENL